MANSITLPDELVERWRTDYIGRAHAFLDVAKEIAQWGADQELEACCELVPGLTNYLRNTRRPKPPSLKEQALTALHAVATGANDTREQHQDLDTIRKALEQLNDK